MKYGTIVADPPWAYKTDKPTSTSNKPHTLPAAIKQYPTLSPSEIQSLRGIRELSAADAHLYLWITNPMIPYGIDLMDAWGFRYVTMLTWRKLGTLGLGYYFRGDTEHVMFGVKGKAPIPPADRVRNWFEAKKTGHSIKPDVLYEIAEKVSPAPRIELFARRAAKAGTRGVMKRQPRRLLKSRKS
jgi:N6-adenosine-specific RNA methylase IME4